MLHLNHDCELLHNLLASTAWQCQDHNFLWIRIQMGARPLPSTLLLLVCVSFAYIEVVNHTFSRDDGLSLICP